MTSRKLQNESYRLWIITAAKIVNTTYQTAFNGPKQEQLAYFTRCRYIDYRELEYMT